MTDFASNNRWLPARTAFVAFMAIVCLIVVPVAAADGPRDASDGAFAAKVVPFLEAYCLDCHSGPDPDAKLNLDGFKSTQHVAEEHQTWHIILNRLQADDMPPKDAERRPGDVQRQSIIDWILKFRRQEALRSAGDPGPVLVRRLSNAEYNNTIRDLTGVDIRPTDSFPVDPANEAGFDNSGESLTMSPALLEKYLAAARSVTEHLVLRPNGIAFAAHPVVTDTDRDKYCVKRIVEFYLRQPTQLSTYFRAALELEADPSEAEFANVAQKHRVSVRYLRSIVQVLEPEGDAETDEQAATAFPGPLTRLRKKWRDLRNSLLPLANSDPQLVATKCAELADFVQTLRQKVVPRVDGLYIEGNHRGSQPFVLWKNRQYVENRQRFDSHLLHSLTATESTVEKADEQKTSAEKTPPVDSDLVLPSEESDRQQALQEWTDFCRIFPDRFYVSERGRDYVDERQKQDGERGRLLSAGFHSMMGYFRDDQPLYDLILTKTEQQEIDDLWDELNFITAAPLRQYEGFLWFERTDSRFMRDPEFDFARPEDKAALTEASVKRLAEVYLAKAARSSGDKTALSAIEQYFDDINQQMRWVERTRLAAEDSHVEALLVFASRAFRRPLSAQESGELKQFYQQLRTDDGFSHEDAIQDLLVSILMSPHFCFRVDLFSPQAKSDSEPQGKPATAPLTDFELASRLSYFLWASTPDEELLHAAASGRLHQPDVLRTQTRRMLQDDRVRGLALEFAGHWLDFRQFEKHNSVDRNRFPQFTDELRAAMFEEPVRFFTDAVQQNRPVREFLSARHTFVNPVLAKHYGLSDAVQDDRPDRWIRFENAAASGRGGLLPMAVFLTQNAPGLRTSPVKRGYWVVKRLLGEQIPPPPPNVPELPADESQLGKLTLRDALARHRDHAACSGCHNRFDSIGLTFEGFGPVGEQRTLDLGGRPVSDVAEFPNGTEGTGVDGLRTYLVEHRLHEFTDNLCRKLVSFALSRTLILPDEILIEQLQQSKSAAEGLNEVSTGPRLGDLIEDIVTSPQFLNKRLNE
ncbi:MAG: DUF1592 domain-containing protein [Planctomycetaceae bacterium]|nr:DUF1592 domain-containing protein [Planctomycetaceae bacterium]